MSAIDAGSSDAKAQLPRTRKERARGNLNQMRPNSSEGLDSQAPPFSRKALALKRASETRILRDVAALVRAITWMTLCVIGLAYLIVPLSLIIKSLPDLIVKTDTISVGEIKLKINPNTLPAPEPDVAAVLKSINQSGLFILLSAKPNLLYCKKESEKSAA